MLNQFSRTQLLVGRKAMERLFAARVAVFGIGGVGLILAGEVVKDLCGGLRFPSLIQKQKQAPHPQMGRFRLSKNDRFRQVSPSSVIRR